MEDPAEVGQDVFEPVEVDRVADAAVEQIEELILAGVLRPGQKLPAERELSDRLGISRPKLREALDELESRGLLETRRSEGTFVRPLAGPVLGPEFLALCARRGRGLPDLMEFRREQEVLGARLAASRATDADHAGLGAVLAEHARAQARGDAAREAELDLRFHMGVIEAAHNAVLAHVMRPVYALLRNASFYRLERLYDRPGTRARLIEQHREILAALVAADPEAAAEAAARHLAFAQDVLSASRDEARRRRMARKRHGLPGA